MKQQFLRLYRDEVIHVSCYSLWKPSKKSYILYISAAATKTQPGVNVLQRTRRRCEMFNPSEQIDRGLKGIETMLQQILGKVQTPAQEEANLITRKQAAMMLGIFLPTLDELVKFGDIVAFRMASSVLSTKGDIITSEKK